MKRKVDCSDLQIGMYVEELDRPWVETHFLFQGFKIADLKDIESLSQLCKYVYIDTEQSDMTSDSSSVSSENNVSQALHALHEGAEAQDLNISVVEEEIHHAKAIHSVAASALKLMMSDLRLGVKVNVETVKSAVDALVSSIERNPDALMLLGRLEQKHNDAVSHSLGCAILALNFGRYIGITGESLKILGLAALLHDVGETKVPDEVLKRSNHKTRKEVLEFHRHPEYGKEILSQVAGISKAVVDVAWCHHERVDGKGYPRHLKGDEIPLFARMVSVVDFYEWLTSGSAGRTLSSSEAVRFIYLHRNEIFDPKCTEQFIQCLGIYPVGSLVELASGCVGIVVGISPEARLYPRLMLVMDEDKQYLHPPRLINLAHFQDKANAAALHIDKVLPGDAYGINLHEFVQRELGAA